MSERRTVAGGGRTGAGGGPAGRREVTIAPPQIAVPAVSLYLIWRFHVSSELVDREIAIRPFDDWYIDLIPHILMEIFLRAFC